MTTSAGGRSEGFYDFDNKLQTAKVKSLSRTYIQYAQGLIKEMNFDTKSGNFSAIVQFNKSIKAPTMIYHHSVDEYPDTIWYPNDFNLSIKNVKSDGPVPIYERFTK